MTIVVLAQAADEFAAAASHYEALQPELGRRFRNEVDRHAEMRGKMGGMG